MPLSFKVVCLFVTGVSIFGCGLDERDRLIKDGLDNLEFPCNESTSEFYFRGQFGDDSLCLYPNQYDCYTEFAQWTSWTISGPSTTLGDTITGEATTWVSFGINQDVPKDDGVSGGFAGQDYYLIRTPKMKSGPSTDSLVQAFLQPGPSSFWSHDRTNLGIAQGLEVYIYHVHYNSKFKFKRESVSLDLTSSRGDQTGSYIEIIELNVKEIENHVEGYIHLRFKCKMYLDGSGPNTELDGEYVGEFSGEVNMPVSYDR